MQRFPARFYKFLGSLAIAVPVLITLATVLAWGTIYETRFGTAAVQRTIYTSWWFQLLLGFLAVNLAAAAMQRYPWQRKHLPFVTAHLSIILILLGGIIGGRFGIQGQLIIPEGEAENTLQTFQNVLHIRQHNPGIEHVVPTHFESQAWVQEPNLTLPLDLEGRSVQLTVDRYYPNASAEEEIAGDGPEDNPAVQVRLTHEEHEETVWLLARDPDRFGISWGETHLLFIEPRDEAALARILHPDGAAPANPRGVVTVELPGALGAHEIPVPETLNQPLPIADTPYTITFKDYFPDFEMDEQGLRSRSDLPNNPVVTFTLSGPEGTDPHMLFALHPDFTSIHGWQFTIPAQVRYTFEADPALPERSIVILQKPAGGLLAVFEGAGGERQVVDPLEIGARHTHPALGYEMEVLAYHPRALVTERFTNQGQEVKAEALHLVAQEGQETAQAWLRPRQTVELRLGSDPILVEYGPARRQLPLTVKLMDFRKIDYPGLELASGFESDVQVTDTQRGLILMRTISMNHPLRYRGFSFYQSSYIPGSPEVTILSVRNDPGTPLVYAGFITVIIGVVAMFILRAISPEGDAHATP